VTWFLVRVLRGFAFWVVFLPGAALLWICDAVWRLADWLERDDEEG